MGTRGVGRDAALAKAYQDTQGTEPDQGWWWVSDGDVSGPWVPGEPDDGGGGVCPPTCLNHDHGAYVMDDDGDFLDDPTPDRCGLRRGPGPASQLGADVRLAVPL